MSDTFDSYPLTRWNPEYGAVTVDTAEEAKQRFVPAHNWFKTMEEADAHRTEAEAGRTLQHSRRMIIDGKPLEETDRVLMSVQHEERTVKPMRAALEETKRVQADSENAGGAITARTGTVMDEDGKQTPTHTEAG